MSQPSKTSLTGASVPPRDMGLAVEHLWDRTFDALPDLIMVLDKHHRVVRVNRAMAQRLGRAPEQCVGHVCFQTVHGLKCPPEICPHARTIADGREHSAELYEERLSGHFLVTTTRVADEQGNTIGSVHVARDISERKRAEDELRESREWLRVTLASIGDAVMTTDTAGRITFLNPVAEALTGWKMPAALGQPVASVFRIINEETRQPAEDIVGRVLREGNIVNLANHTALVSRAGQEIPIEDSAAPIKDKTGKVVGAVVVFYDVTEKRRVLDQIRNTALFPEEDPFPVLRVTQAGTLLFANRASAGLLAHWDCQVGGVVPELAWRALTRALETGAAQELEIRDGQARDLLLTFVPIAERGYVNLYGRDITERKRAEEEVRENRADLNRAQAVARTGSWRLDVRRNELWWSDEAYRIFGIARGTPLTYEVFLEAVHPADRAYVNTQWHAALRGAPYDIEHRIVANGAVKWVRERAELEFDPKGNLLGGFGTVQDVTEQKQSAQALAASEQRFKLLAEVSARLLEAENPQAVVEELCHSVMQHLGCECFFNFLADEASGRLRLNACAGIPASEVRNIEWLDYGVAVCGCVARDGERIVVQDIQRCEDPRTALVKAYGIQAYACHPLRAQGRVIGTLSFGSKSRPTFAAEELELMKSVTDQVAVAMQRLQDMEALRAAQSKLQRVNEELEQRVQERTARLREIINDLEHFSYAITHDMRAPLRSMRSFSDLLYGACAECGHSDRKDFLRRISNAAGRMDQLITDALDYSKVIRQEQRLKPVDAGALLRDIVESYPHLHAPNAEIQIDLPIPKVLGNEAGLTQCFSNLLGNAVKFVAPGKAPQVRVWAEVVEAPSESLSPESRVSQDNSPLVYSQDEPQRNVAGHMAHAPAFSPPAPHRRYVRVWVEDKGIGIAREYQQRIWVMFQRLDKSYEGTGIGLALVRKIVERLGGRVGVESELGRGSRFWLELKKAE